MLNIVKCVAVGLAAIGFGCSDSATSTERSSSIRVPEGSVVAVAVDKDNFIARLEASLGAEQFAQIKELFLDKLESDGGLFLKEAGLDLFDLKWGVITCNMPEFDRYDEIADIPDCAFVARIDHDSAKFMQTLKKTAEKEVGPGDPEVCEGEVDGVKILYPKAPERKLPRTPMISFASLDGKLLIIASSKEFIEKMIVLYKDGKGESEKFDAFKLDSADALRIKIVDIGENLAKTPLARQLRALNELNPNLEKIVLRLKGLEISEESLMGGKLARTTVIIETGSEEDASSLKAVIDILVAKGKIELDGELQRQEARSNSYSSPEKNETLEMLRSLRSSLDSLKVETSGATLTIASEGEVSIIYAMAQTVSAMNITMQSANASAVSANGRKLFTAIISGSIDRNNMGLPDLWPHSTEADGLGSDSEDIAGKVFNSSTEWFNELFDMAHYGTSDYEPWVDCDLSVLRAPFVKPYSPGAMLTSENIPWTVASGVTDTFDDNFPVLVSSNLDPSVLLAKWDGYSDAYKPLASAVSGKFKTVIVIRRGGGVDIIKPENLNYRNLYRSAFATPSGVELRYLTPTGAVSPRR